VRDEHNGQETYWAHPWPTWSWFFGKEDYRPGGGSWDMQQAVPLRAIFILEQGEEDQVEPMGPAHALCTLTELAAQTSRHLLQGLPLDEIAVFNLQRFENLCALVQTVPAYLLHVSRDGAFWEEIEQVILQDPWSYTETEGQERCRERAT
jgi:SynChlorMet cassette protein ScmC